jgi:hypothetical protein
MRKILLILTVALAVLAPAIPAQALVIVGSSGHPGFIYPKGAGTPDSARFAVCGADAFS